MSPVPPVKVCVACEESSRTSLERCEWCGGVLVPATTRSLFAPINPPEGEKVWWRR